MILTPDGYDQAVRREIDRRDRAWISAPLPLGKGVTLLPYTLRRHLTLSATGNRLATGKGEPQLADVLAFLWLCSTAYRAPTRPLWRLSRWLFWRQCVRLPIGAMEAVRGYLDDAWGDCPVPMRKAAFKKAPKTGPVAQYVLRLAPAGWRLEDVLDRPMGQVWQMMRAVDLSEDPGTLYDDESERVKFAYINQRNQAAKAPADKPAQGEA
jgi:hypothetical protein